MWKKWLLYSFLFFLLLCAGGAVFLTWGYYRITRDLPELSSIEDYKPDAVTKVYANDGTLIAEFFDQRRYPVKISEVPRMVINCFLAAEDAHFYSHKGIDYTSILRAVFKNLRAGNARQGGSTITQQVVKNLLLTPEKKYERKIKEAILSYRLENRFSKDEILQMYLNQIYFGNTAYGIQAAARIYFHKDVTELTLAEAATLAGLVKAPSLYSPLRNPDYAKRRLHYVLEQMLKAGFISKDEKQLALNERVKVYPAKIDNIYHAPYFVTEVRRLLTESQRWKELDIDHAGYQIYTTLDLNADNMARAGLIKGLREVDKRRGWRGPIGFIQGASKQDFLKNYTVNTSINFVNGNIYLALVTEILRDKGVARIDLGAVSSAIEYKNVEWAKKKLDSNDHASWVTSEHLLKVGDVIEVSFFSNESDKKYFVLPGIEKQFQLDQTPQVEGASVVIDPYSGRVLTVQGGYDYSRSRFNRVTQGVRQPGSTFKPIVYFAALDGFKYTPATIVDDSPQTYRVGDSVWSPGNFDGKFLGPMTLRTALEKSRNSISAQIVAGIGVDPIINYARKLGIQSPLGRNLSISLGSSEVTLLELSRAYGVFAAKGMLFDSVFIERIVSRDGQEIYNYENEKINNAKQVINENSAFVMANMMKGVVDNGTGYKVKEIKRPVAGKTGTSNDQMDAWFIGYTPQWVCGVWVGFDEKRKIGEKETGGVVAAPIWLYTMRDFLNYKDQATNLLLEREAKEEAERLGIAYVPPEPVEPLDFSVPEGVDPFWVDRSTGLLSSAGSEGAIYEYFIRGTEPKKSIDSEEEETSSYLQSSDL
jgi:penicillin-binding protein 1A